MHITNPGHGFIFLSIALGFLSIVMVCTAFDTISNKHEYADRVLWITVPTVIAFLASGFLGFAGLLFR